MKKLSTNEFICRAKKVHGDKFDYSKTNYIDTRTKVKIICPIHGEFEQYPNGHLNGKFGCNKCGGRSKLETDDYIKQAKKIHGNTYDYSKLVYVNAHTKIEIVCKIHGSFKQRPDSHLNGRGCPICGSNKLTTQEFIKRSKKIHGNIYDYSNVNYINWDTKVNIICALHGAFLQSVGDHLFGKGCPKCSSIVSKPELEICEFLKENNIKFKQSNRSLIKPYELDIVIPSKRVAIEFNGQYWHSDKMIKRCRRWDGTAEEYHEMKSKMCIDVGWELVHIFEEDWINDKQRELNKILDALKR